MATLTDSRPEHIGPIDPHQAPVFAEISFTVPKLKDIDWDDAVLSYDRLSDILMVFVGDRSQPAVVVYGDDADDNRSYLVNPDTRQFVGWQLESFLTSLVSHDPSLIEVLDKAELIGITADELRDERQRAIANIRHRRSSRKADILQGLITGNR